MSDDAHNRQDDARVVVFSVGKNVSDAYPIQKAAASFAEFAQFICDHRSKKKGELYFCAPFAPNGDGKHHRGKEDVQPRRFLPLDLDYVENGETLADLLLALQPWTHFTYTTASHTPQKPRVRGVIELSRAVDRAEGIRCGLALESKLLEAAGINNGAVKFDNSVYKGEQPCFGPLTDAEVYPRDFQLSGTALDVDALLADAPEIATEVTAVDRAGHIIETDPRVRYLYDAGFVLKAKAPLGKLAIRCPNAAAHSSETSPTACVVLLPHFNGVVEAAIHCMHESCATLTQAQFWKLAGWSEAKADERKGAAWPPPLDLAAMGEREPKPPTWIVDEWLPTGYATLLAGHGGVGKSAIALHLGVCIALGLTWAGIDCEPRWVLYLSCEDREGVLHWRLDRICRHLGISLAELVDRLHIVELVGHDSILWDRDPRTGHTLTPAFGNLQERMRASGIEVLMVDGVSDTFAGNENARGDVKRYVNALLSLVPVARGALLLVGHVNRPTAASGATGEGYSGSTGWHNAVRSRLYLYPETAQSEDEGRAHRTGRLHLEIQKSNLGAPDQAIAWRWDDDAHMFLPEARQTEFDRRHRDREEQRGILLALRACAAACVVVPAAVQGPRTGYHVLTLRPELPDSLRSGRPGVRRFWRQIEHLRQIRHVEEREYRRANGHKGAQLCLTTEGERHIAT